MRVREVVIEGTPYECVLRLLPMCSDGELTQLKLYDARRAQQQRTEEHVEELKRARVALGLQPLRLAVVEPVEGEPDGDQVDEDGDPVQDPTAVDETIAGVAGHGAATT